MSDDKSPSDSNDESVEDATFDLAEETAEQAPDEGRAEAPKPRLSGVHFLTWLGLFSGVAALLLAGAAILRQPDAAPVADTSAVDDVAAAVRSVEDSIAALERNVSSLGDRLAARDSEIGTIERRLGERTDQLESVRGRMAVLESTVSSLQGISTGARDAWLLAEAEYYLQIANVQLQLAGDPVLAGNALRLADERILTLANPALTGVRRALAGEIQAVAVMQKPDVTGLTLTLAGLAGVVDSLPLRQEADLPADDEDVPIDPEASGASRAMASLRDALSSAVSVRQVDEAVRPFIAPEAQYFLRANLELQFQSARLALLRGEQSLFEQSLDDASLWLNEFFDTGSTQVTSVLETIGEVRDHALSVDVPDISGSLRLLRQYNALQEAAAEAGATATDENPNELQQ